MKILKKVVISKLFKILLCAFIFQQSVPVFSQEIKSMEFHNQEIKDILFVFAQQNNFTILTDDTVSGKADFIFSNSNSELALHNFLEKYNLYYEKENDIYKISKIKCEYNEAADKIYLICKNTNLKSVLEKISDKTRKTIIFNSIPDINVNLNIHNLNLIDALKICEAQLINYKLETNSDYFSFQKIDLEKFKNEIENEKQNYLKLEENFFSVEIDKIKIKTLLKDFFALAKKEYLLFFNDDFYIENFMFKNKTFEELFNLILNYANLDYANKEEIFYITEKQKNSSSNQSKIFKIFNLTYIDAEELKSQWPSQFSNIQFNIDNAKNSILIYASFKEIENIQNLINLIDKPENQKIYSSQILKYMNCDDFINLATSKFKDINFLKSKNPHQIITYCTKNKLKDLENFIFTVDCESETYPVNLKYIKSSTLIEFPPPDFDANSFIDSGFPNLVFFKGSKEKYNELLSKLKFIDLPQPQIKYELLVIQSTKNTNKSFKPEFSLNYSNSNVKEDDNSILSFATDLSQIFGINFNIISKLGYDFAFSLNNQLNKSQATICTDTSLTGITGQEIQFQNTDTYRYIEYEYDKNNSSNTIGITQTITSGLIINITGWISGSDMITMDINASISKQNSESNSSSSSVSTLPSTSERIVNTQLRTKSGEAIIIGGLLKDEENLQTTSPTFFSRIPIIRKLFQQESKSKEQSEITIYIVPTLLKDFKDSSENKNSISVSDFCRKYIDEKI